MIVEEVKSNSGGVNFGSQLSNSLPQNDSNSDRQQLLSNQPLNFNFRNQRPSALAINDDLQDF